MKKATIFAVLIAAMVFVSCKKDVPPPPPEAPMPVEAPAPPPPAPEAPTPKEEKDGTTIKVGKDGVDVSTKNEDKKTKVAVKNGEASVEVKK